MVCLFARPLAPLVVLALVVGCATQRPHTTLDEAPTADAPLDERARYYKAHAADSLEQDHVFLHDGTRVYYPEDLLPAVDEDSPTAEAISDHVEARESVESWSVVSYPLNGVAALGGLVLLGGLAGLGGGLALTVFQQDTYAEYALYGGLAVMVAGGVIGTAGAVGSMLFSWLVTGADSTRAYEAAERAARTYNQSLSDRLGVGVDADGVIFDLRRRQQEAGQPEERPSAPEEKAPTPAANPPQEI